MINRKIYNEKSNSIQENLSYKKINKEPEEEMYKRKKSIYLKRFSVSLE